MAHPCGSPGKKFTYAEYLTWPDDERWELIDGEAFDMTPPPSTEHQFVAGRLFRFFDEFFEGKACHAYYSPFEVCFPKTESAQESGETAVWPDIAVVSDKDRLTSRGYRGAPELIVEVLSPRTASHDQIRKRRLYERHGVKEFWVVHPLDRVATIFRQVAGQGFGSPEFYSEEDRLGVSLFPGLTIDFSRIFPPQEKVVRERPSVYQTPGR